MTATTAPHHEFAVRPAPFPQGTADVTLPNSRPTKVRRVGGSLGVILPREVLFAAGMSEGDAVSAQVTPHGILLVPRWLAAGLAR